MSKNNTVWKHCVKCDRRIPSSNVRVDRRCGMCVTDDTGYVPKRCKFCKIDVVTSKSFCPNTSCRQELVREARQ